MLCPLVEICIRIVTNLMAIIVVNRVVIMIVAMGRATLIKIMGKMEEGVIERLGVRWIVGMRK